jgi:hypothetical protein
MPARAQAIIHEILMRLLSKMGNQRFPDPEKRRKMEEFPE